MSLLELTLVGGPWAKRLARRRAGIDALPWHEARGEAPPEVVEAARVVWTQSAFSELAAAAAFAEIAAALMAAGAPLDLCAAAGDFVVDEAIHAELSARMATALGGAVALEVDLRRLVRPAIAAEPLLRAAELVVRSCCVGEALTIPVLKATRARSRPGLVREVVARIAREEGPHAELGWWFLDWAAPRLSEADRAHLGRAAGAAIAAFAPVFAGACAGGSDLGVMDCAGYDASFAGALRRAVLRPLSSRGIAVPAADLACVDLAAA
jgi:hypothetical protein